MSNHEIAELTWENGQLAMHEFGGIFAAASNKGPIWDTLESVVQQATISNKESGPIPVAVKNGGSVVASSGGRLVEKKRTRSESDQQMKLCCNEQDWAADISVCASANAAFCRESDRRTMSTWASRESSRSTRTKTTEEDDSACHTGSENLEGRVNKSDTEHSNPVRKGRAAAVHNQSERRRRDRINQKMKALQKLVPNATKTDKASVLDEVIEYLKQLQAQVQMMSASSMTQHMMMMPLGMQQHIQMSSFLARAGMGMGMLNVAAAQTPPLFVPPVGPSSAPQQAKPDPVNPTSLVPLHDPYNAFLSQSMNMEMYNRMAALYGQQMNQSMKTSNHNPTQEG